MNYIGKDEMLLEILNTQECIRDSQIIRFDVYEDLSERVIVDVYIDLIYDKDKKMKIKLVDVQEYSFYYQRNRTFYNIETFKFLHQNSLYYICFDPYEENEVVSQNDQDFILAKSVEAYYILR